MKSPYVTRSPIAMYPADKLRKPTKNVLTHLLKHMCTHTPTPTHDHRTKQTPEVKFPASGKKGRSVYADNKRTRVHAIHLARPSSSRPKPNQAQSRLWESSISCILLFFCVIDADAIRRRGDNVHTHTVLLQLRCAPPSGGRTASAR